jgi:acetyl-CoA carboxylase carboxyl transferase subunit beta
MPWLKRENPPAAGGKAGRELPDGLWVKCEGCAEILYFKELERNLHVCTKCTHHFRITARRYVEILLDPGSFIEMDAGVVSLDPLGFRDSKRYIDRLKDAREDRFSVTPSHRNRSPGGCQGLGDGLRVHRREHGERGGEKIARRETVPGSAHAAHPALVLAGAHDGRILTMVGQDQRAAGAARRGARAYVCAFTDPATGGTTASFAQLDVQLAEPGALIGFAGPRVIRETVAQELPEGFQRAEFLLKHGFIDRIVPRAQMRPTLGRVLRIFADGLSTLPGAALKPSIPPDTDGGSPDGGPTSPGSR